MSLAGTTRPDNTGVSLAGVQFAVLSTRNLLFLMAVLAMNFTLFRPSPVDLLYIASFLVTLFYLTLSPPLGVTRRAVLLALVVGAWAVSYFVASAPHIGEENVPFELLAKTFAIMIAVIGAFVSMSWNKRHVETFMKVYVVSCSIASVLGILGFLTQNQLLTWDGRAKGLIDDPNMYGSFLIPAVMFCAYLLTRTRANKLFFLGAMGLVLLGIFFSLSRIALVAALACLLAYIFFQNRRDPRRLLLILLSLIMAAVLLPGLISIASPEFSERFLERLTLAQPYDLGEQGRYGRYLLVLPMIAQDPIGVGVLQLEKIFPEPIHNIWLSSFVNYGWGGGFAWLGLIIGSAVISVRNYRRTGSDIPVVMVASLVGIVMCATLHEGEHWRHMWLFFGLVWGLNMFCIGGGETKPAARQGQRAPRR
ncbi:O-antigen ligase family protein [Devosia sediminis]|uniref:O-antigen ligase family protein n=1 Tax=Devosia sediminis TaxID=2798801 RepID=A0A934IRG5_9HYPH|nr:O-antigen ligase family protein [Devosia sediminis]MBJ3785454.1 O-antigen ligase family protein [Devosia sediminis]